MKEIYDFLLKHGLCGLNYNLGVNGTHYIFTVTAHYIGYTDDNGNFNELDPNGNIRSTWR
jgi:hypothetical protein